MKAIKTSWFGYVTNAAVKLAQQYNAFAACEALEIAAAEKGAPDYKGRTFNGRINNGAQGRYHRILSARLGWFGVPEVPAPSFYTSAACVPHGRVEKAMRRKEAFNCPECPMKKHAGRNAAATIAHYLLLRPKAAAPTGSGKVSGGRSDKRSTCDKASNLVPGAAPEASSSGGNRVSEKPRPTA